VTGNRIDVQHAVTSSLSQILLRGQMRCLHDGAFHPTVAWGDGPQSEEIGAAESIPVFTVEREISPWKDRASLVRATQLVFRLHLLAQTPAQRRPRLLVGLASGLNRALGRVYTWRGLRAETVAETKRWIYLFCLYTARVLPTLSSKRDPWGSQR